MQRNLLKSQKLSNYSYLESLLKFYKDFKQYIKPQAKILLGSLCAIAVSIIDASITATIPKLVIMLVTMTN